MTDDDGPPNSNLDYRPKNWFLITTSIVLLVGLLLLALQLMGMLPKRQLNLSERIQNVSKSEVQIEELSASMAQLQLFFKNRQLPQDAIFQTKLDVVGQPEHSFASLVSQAPVAALPGQQYRIVHPKLSSQVQSIAPAELWAALTHEGNFEVAQFGTLAGRFVSPSEFHTDTKFEGRLPKSGGLLRGVLAYQTIQWVHEKKVGWRIKRWKQTDLKLIEGTAMFEDVSSSAFPDNDTLETLQRSSHQEILLKNSQTPGENIQDVSYRYRHFNDWESAYQYPAVSVVDVNQDGYDDLFVTDRWQPAQLLLNQTDGTFKDATKERGLSRIDLACCALFADFDNDGDPDLFVGRTLEPSMFFENVEGVFELDESYTEEFEFLRFVVSGSVVDINRDGLLDLYLCSYGFSTEDSAWSSGFFRPDEVEEMEDRVKNSNWFINRGGATNVVLLNDGKKLKSVGTTDTLAQWRNTYQSAWSDFDLDGDPDVYICNDFAPDVFLRNDTPRGSFELAFKDVSRQIVVGGTMGFGMGASWGDFDNDGRLDLYVSNMYSKAGNRIVEQLEEVDDRIKVSAQGSFLYRNVDGRFQQVAGLEDNDQQVSKVGWSFGGQFADFNNDGKLDLYVPSGFYTPPPEIQQPGDL